MLWFMGSRRVRHDSELTEACGVEPRGHKRSSGHHGEKPQHSWRVVPILQLEKSPHLNEGPVQPKIKLTSKLFFLKQ